MEQKPEGQKLKENAEFEEEKEIHFLDYLIVLAKRKKLILGITSTVAVIMFITALLLKASFYEAETSILPPQEENISIANQFIRDFGIFPVKRGNIYNQQELLVEIIKSRTFSDRIIERFKLKEAYGVKNMEMARIRFFKSLTIQPDFTDKGQMSLLKGPQSPLMRISVRDKNSERAVNIANTIVEELKSFIRNFAITEASQRRLFFEEQLKLSSEALARSEEDIRMFQQKTGLLQVESQTAMVIEKIASLEAQITAKEVELQVIRSYSTGSNPDVQKVEETIRALRKELAKLESDKGNGKNLFVPTGTIPSLGLEYKRKFRELKFNETLYEILVKQYELAKIDESKDAFVIQVIDKAVPPEKKKTTRTYGGKKAMMTTISAFILSCFLAFVMEFRERSSNKPNERLTTLKRYLSFRKKS